MQILSTLVLLVVVELLAFYGWSLLFLAEGAPTNHNFPHLNALAWLCIGAALLAPVVFIVWLSRRVPPGK